VGEKLKLWIENNWVDFQRNMKKKKFSNLFREIMDIISARKNLCKQILELIESKEQTPEKEIFHIKQDRSLPVKDFIPIFFQNSDQQIAKFLTFIEFGYWIQIENREWLSSNYTKQNKYELAPHIMLCIDFANYLTGFVHTALLSQEQVGERVKILKRLVRIAKVLLDLGNYSTATTIIFALKSSFIERLTKTFYQLKLLHETDWNLLVTLSQLLDITRLMSMYEKFLRTYPFCLPTICVLTKKISTLHEMIHDDFQNGVLDIKNRNLLGAVLVQIRDWQNLSFQFDLKDLTFEGESFFNLLIMTEDDQKRDRSKQLEPPSTHCQSRKESYLKRKSLELKIIITRLPLQSINESLPADHTSPLVSPTTGSLSNSGSDRENQSPKKDRNSLKRLNTNSPTSPRLVVKFAEDEKEIDSPRSPNSPRRRLSERNNKTHRGRLELSRSEVPTIPLTRILSPRGEKQE
jgi:hypothetical protein